MVRRNAEREGVIDRIELMTADIRSIPLPDDSFDVVVSSLAIHNLSEITARDEVIDEAVRLIRPGGTLLIADIRATSAYADRLRHRGMADVFTRDLGWRFWYGSPFVVAKLVSAPKTVSPNRSGMRLSPTESWRYPGDWLAVPRNHAADFVSDARLAAIPVFARRTR